MNWYLSKLIFSINPNDRKELSEFDEQFRLIRAEDPLAAYLKAKALGMKEQQTEGELIWKFVDVADILHLNELADGSEIWSNTIETSERENFINSVRLKSQAIQSKSLLLC